MNKINIISWNIACLPSKINFISNPKKRINAIIQILKNISPDIICLQEAFDHKVVNKIIENLPEYHFALTPTTYSFMCYDGLLIASKFPIENTHFQSYGRGTGEECLVEKCILSASIYLPFLKESILIHNTHLQSDGIFSFSRLDMKHRIKQTKIMTNQITKNPIALNILCGDFNIKLNEPLFQKFHANLSNIYKHILFNDIEIFTCDNNQLDYIICLSNDPHVKRMEFYNKKYKCSDHCILLSKLYFD